MIFAPKRRCEWHGLTLIETLVMLAILAALLGILLPILHFARESSRNISCTNNLRQLEIALEHAGSVHKRWPSHPQGTIGGWAIWVLPFIEETTLADALSNTTILDPSNPPEAARRRPWALTCPSGFEGDSDVKTLPPAHYTGSSLGTADVPTNFRAAWVLSPLSPDLPTGMGPHWGGGYNTISGTGEGTYSVRFVTGSP